MRFMPDPPSRRSAGPERSFSPIALRAAAVPTVAGDERGCRVVISLPAGHLAA
jgi:hypothetical protein